MSIKIIKKGVNSKGFIALLVLFLFPSFAFSQTLQPSDLSDTQQGPNIQQISADTNKLIQQTLDESVKNSISLEINPEYPEAFEDTTVKITSTLVDLMRANVSWYLNGKLKDGGLGKNLFMFRTGKIGEINTISAVITTVDGLEIKRQISINPTNFDIIWEADTYVPPFYKGKALAIARSAVKIVALPDFYSGGKQINPKDLVYVWRDNNKDAPFTDSSGYGKNVLSLSMSQILRDTNISVETSSRAKSIRSQQNIILAPQNTRLLFYESNPVEGIIYEKAISGTFNLTREDFSVKAEPYFFSNKSRSGGNLSYGWFLGGKKITPDSSEQITLKQTGNSSGVSSLSLTIENLTNIFEQASKSFTLNFKKESLSF